MLRNGALGAVMRLVQRWSFGALVRSAPTSVRDDVRIIDGTALGGGAGEPEALIPALDLIEQKVPERYARLKKVMNTVVLMPIGRGAEWVGNVKACYIDRDTVLDHPSAAVASLLVHESTHAYLDHLGCRWSPDRYPRIEAICIREEIRFAEILGDKELEHWARRRLHNIPPLGHWDEDRLINELAVLPKWMGRLYEYAHRNQVGLR